MKLRKKNIEHKTFTIKCPRQLLYEHIPPLYRLLLVKLSSSTTESPAKGKKEADEFATVND